MIHEISLWLVQLVDGWGYFGIFFMMAIESSVFPLPSELVMIPAGYLVQQGQMNFLIAVFAGSLGSLFGAWFNYLLALWAGRPFLHRYGKYFFVGEKHLIQAEEFFKKHGHIATFTGRLVFIIRHLISLPAGLAKMNAFEFSAYTFLGAAVWNGILVALGFFIGQNQALLNEYLHQIVIGVVIFVVLILVVYWAIQKRRNR